MTETITCGLLIKQINDALEKRANNMLRPDRLTVTQLGALLALDRAVQRDARRYDGGFTLY